MSRTRIALDECLPKRLGALLTAGFGDYGFEFMHIRDLVGPSTADEVWADRFKQFGGHATLSADKDIVAKPHKLKAFIDNGLICFFCEKRWSNWSGNLKVAHILYWWPYIARELQKAKPGDCYWIPANMSGRGVRPFDANGSSNDPKGAGAERLQVDKFRELARELECDEDEDAFKAKLRKVATARPKPGKRAHD